MENGLKALYIAAGLIITCMILELGFHLFYEGQSIYQQMEEHFQTAKNHADTEEVIAYNGLTISGSLVCYLITKWSDRMLVFEVRNEEGDIILLLPDSKIEIDYAWLCKQVDSSQRFQASLLFGTEDEIRGMRFTLINLEK